MSEKEQKDKATLPGGDIQKHLFESRSVMIYGEIDMDLASKVNMQLLALSQASHDPIRVFVNSPGGHVEAGDSIHDVIKFIPAPVHMIGTGWVASIAAIIYLGAKKENRFSLKNTRFLLHQPHGGMQGSAQDVKIQAEEIIKMRHRLNQIISEESNVSLEKVAEHTDRDYWLGADEAVKYGLVNKVIETMDQLPK